MPAMAVPMPNATANAPTRPTHMVMSICPTSRRFIGPLSYAAVICGNDDDEHWPQCVAFRKFIPEAGVKAKPFAVRQKSSLSTQNATNRQQVAVQYLLNSFATTSVLRQISTLDSVTAVTAGQATVHWKRGLPHAVPATSVGLDRGDVDGLAVVGPVGHRVAAGRHVAVERCRRSRGQVNVR